MKLQPLLTEYLIEQGSLPLAGTGRLSVKHNAAALKEGSKLLVPPADRIAFSVATPSDAEQQKLVDFISNRLQVSIAEATDLLKEDGSLQNTLDAADNFDWSAVGHFQKRQDGTILFTQEDVLSKYLPSISLTSLKQAPLPEPVLEIVTEAPVVKETAPVYEQVETVGKDRWWIWAIVIFVVAVALILIKFYAMV